MADYRNSNRSREGGEDRPAKEEVKKVIAGEAIVPKKGLGRKFKDLFVEADLRGAISYVTTDVLIPAARNMIFDSATTAIERVMYGDSPGSRRRPGSGSGARFTYNTPVNRGIPRDVRDATSRIGSSMSSRPRNRRAGEDIIVSSRDEADSVITVMGEIIDKYGVASLADLHDLVGLEGVHTDHKWGWIYVADVKPRQIREGWVLEFPPVEPIE